ncbi:hypothetical protein [Pedobacter alluvionis]|uniref:Uncharacterized protein n=1 Tax=Pedobacter alluvionis TaxID=475253 RepID=A0A497YAD5_9SPHI|nr:hypothetical protein [Pedobacter alluvionis]RLJ80522.1 hypothetical protein BCL90_1304 [Pedobacter alluvionis]TFB31792.1 hypothetical protein E3V97_14525 [Pedobacter alluvionis]
MAQIPPITDAYIDEIVKASDAYNPALNKSQGVKLRELIKKLRDYFTQEIQQPSNGDYIQVSPSEPQNASINITGDLTAGQSIIAHQGFLKMALPYYILLVMPTVTLVYRLKQKMALRYNFAISLMP